MRRLFKHYIPDAVLLMGLFDVGLLILAAELAFRLRAQQVGTDPGALTDRYLAFGFVGPRPERPEFVADLEEKLSFYAERHMVKPEITGWAQINYPCGAPIVDARQKLEFDLYYAQNYTPFLDLLILLQTLRVVLWHESAR